MVKSLSELMFQSHSYPMFQSQLRTALSRLGLWSSQTFMRDVTFEHLETIMSEVSAKLNLQFYSSSTVYFRSCADG